jgi:hypothetical protein
MMLKLSLHHYDTARTFLWATLSVHVDFFTYSRCEGVIDSGAQLTPYSDIFQVVSLEGPQRIDYNCGFAMPDWDPEKSHEPPVAIVAITSSPSSARHTPSH